MSTHDAQHSQDVLSADVNLPKDVKKRLQRKQQAIIYELESSKGLGSIKEKEEIVSDEIDVTDSVRSLHLEI